MMVSSEYWYRVIANTIAMESHICEIGSGFAQSRPSIGKYKRLVFGTRPPIDMIRKPLSAFITAYRCPIFWRPQLPHWVTKKFTNRDTKYIRNHANGPRFCKPRLTKTTYTA